MTVAAVFKVSMESIVTPMPWTYQWRTLGGMLSLCRYNIDLRHSPSSEMSSVTFVTRMSAAKRRYAYEDIHHHQRRE